MSKKFTQARIEEGAKAEAVELSKKHGITISDFIREAVNRLIPVARRTKPGNLKIGGGK